MTDHPTTEAQSCLHPSIRGMYAEKDGEIVVAMWACDNPDCSRRFYPACEKCITVGHREGMGEHR